MYRFWKSLPFDFLLYALLLSAISFNVHADDPSTLTIKAKSTPPVKWLQHNILLNGIGVGVESAHKLILVPLGKGYDKPSRYDAKFNYQLANLGYTFAVQGSPLKNDSHLRLQAVRYGYKAFIKRYRKGNLVDTYTLVFTNLPVIQLSAARIVNEPKSPGTFRLLSGQFRQDTGIQKMGIEFRGSLDSQKYEKKSLDVEVAKTTDWTKGQDIKLLDLNKDSDWILDGVYLDTSFFRNLVSQDIFRAIRKSAYRDKNGVAKGQAALRGHLTEVIKNGAYDGVYVLNEKPSRKMYDLQKITVPIDAKGVAQWKRVDFKNPDNGSVLYKASVDNDVFFEAESGQRIFQQLYPNPKDVVRWSPLTAFADFVANASDEDFIAGIDKRVDLDSVVDWWALVLASHAEDNINHNFMMAKSGGGRFYVLSWDHDGSFGVNWFAFDQSTNNLIRRLLTLPATGFNSKLKARWKTLRVGELSQTKMVSRFKTYIDESNKGGARARNTARWPDRGDANMGTATYINRYLTGWLPKADKIIHDLPVK